MKRSFLVTVLIVTAAVLWSGWNEKKIGTLQVTCEALEKSAGDAAGSDSAKRAEAKTGNIANRRGDRMDDASIRKFAAEIITLFTDFRAGATNGDNLNDEMAQRSSRVREALDKLDMIELKSLLQAIRELPIPTDNGGFDPSIWIRTRLAEVDPLSALAMLQEEKAAGKEPEQGALAQTLYALARDNPLAAAKWISEHSGEYSDGLTRGMKGQVLASAAEKDPALAFSMLRDLGLTADQNTLAVIAQSINTTEQGTAMIAAMKDHFADAESNADAKGLKETFTKNIAQVAVRDGFEKGSAWIAANLSEEEGKEAARTIFFGIGPDQEKWLEWMRTRLTEEEMANRTVELTPKWAQENWQATASWLEQQPDGPTKESGITAYAMAAAPYQPESAVELAGTLPVGEMRDGILREIYGSWKRVDEEAARASAKEHGIDF